MEPKRHKKKRMRTKKTQDRKQNEKPNPTQAIGG